MGKIRPKAYECHSDPLFNTPKHGMETASGQAVCTHVIHEISMTDIIEKCSCCANEPRYGLRTYYD